MSLARGISMEREKARLYLTGEIFPENYLSFLEEVAVEVAAADLRERE